MKNLVKLAVCLVLFSGVVRTGFSRGDKIIPQVIAGGDAVTRFDLTNISSSVPIAHMRLAFFHNDGTEWNLQTDKGTGNFTLPTLQPKQILRVQTIGGSSTEGGYAVIYDEETGNSAYSEDYVLGISVFYQISSPSGVTESVSIPLREPTAAVSVPIEVQSPNVYSAFAIVNTLNTSNTVYISLYSENGDFYQSRSFSLTARQQRTAFLDYEQDLFPGLDSFRGTAEITANGPLSILTLRQMRGANDYPQYTLLAPVDRESLRRNSYMVLLQAQDADNPLMPLDIDGFTSDFYRIIGDESDRDPHVLTESYSWDLEYRNVLGNTNSRYFDLFNNAAMVNLGGMNDGQFDALSFPYLKGLTAYSTGNIDLSGSNLYLNLTFAMRTDLGNYAKIRIVKIIDQTVELQTYKDLVLEVVVYK